MADETRQEQDVRPERNDAASDADPGTSSERDFGKTDRYANQDQEDAFNVRHMGDGTSWDSGGEASVTEGTDVETGTRSADAETPGVKTRPQEPPIEKAE